LTSKTAPLYADLPSPAHGDNFFIRVLTTTVWPPRDAIAVIVVPSFTFAFTSALSQMLIGMRNLGAHRRPENGALGTALVGISALPHPIKSAVDPFATQPSDQHKAPQTLQNLIAKGYVDRIPVDPMTDSNTTWRIVMEDRAKIADRDEPGIFDVHSGSDGVSSDGTRYADW